MSSLPRRRWRKSLPALVVMPLAWSFAAACLPGTGPALIPDLDASPPPVELGGEGGAFRVDAGLGDPFAIGGLSPSHGPFTGGTRARIDGRGFSSKIRVFVGGVEVDSGSLLASDPTRAAIVTPPGVPGFVDVKIRDDATATERVLPNGFFYDPFVVSPDSGATSGGTRIAITGSGTTWATGTTVTVGGVACADVVVASATTLECVTPTATTGAKDVVITPPGGVATQVRDAFTYSDSVDGYRGGLSGGILAGRIKVLAFDAFLGKPLPGALAIAGSTLEAAKIQKTSANGVTEIDGIIGDKVTITVAGKCHQPITYVDVPVDTVTVYLQPILTPACIEGDPQSFPGGGGGGGKAGGYVEGALVFPGGKEFERAPWTTVPAPKRPTERRAAYVFEASSSPSGTFYLPPASQAITPDSEGTSGYAYSLLVYPGNATLYVLAGLEDRSVSPPSFVPYSMGIARGVSVPAQGRVDLVDVKMDILFDHEVRVSAAAPAPGPRGPDRLTTSLAITLGASAYAILPNNTRTSPLPAPSIFTFTGFPALDHGLANEQYVLGGVASTGPGQQLPASVVSRVRTTNANDVVSLGGFLGVPVLDEPGAGVWSGKHVSFGGAVGPIDLSVTTVSSSTVGWTIVAPGTTTSFDLPDLAAVTSADPVGLDHGAITTTTYVARIDQFTYGRLRAGQLGAGAWNAYAVDTLGGVY